VGTIVQTPEKVIFSLGKSTYSLPVDSRLQHSTDQELVRNSKSTSYISSKVSFRIPTRTWWSIPCNCLARSLFI